MGSGGKRAEGNYDTSSPNVINGTQPITSKMQFNTKHNNLEKSNNLLDWKRCPVKTIMH